MERNICMKMHGNKPEMLEKFRHFCENIKASSCKVGNKLSVLQSFLQTLLTMLLQRDKERCEINEDKKHVLIVEDVCCVALYASLLEVISAERG